MTTKYPFILEVGTRAIPNITEKVCIWCTNGYKDITYDKLSIVQTGSCSGVLTAKNLTETKFKEMKW